MSTESNSVDRTDWHVSLLGGFKRRGPFTLPARTAVITLIGGVDLDLGEARFAADEAVVTKVSIIGGVKVTAPPGTRVVVEGFTLVGGRYGDGYEPADHDGPTVRIRAFGVFGGVKVVS
jgi:predicted membrane protein